MKTGISASLITSYCQKIKRSTSSALEVFRGQSPVVFLISILSGIDERSASSYDDLVCVTLKRIKRDSMKVKWTHDQVDMLASALLTRGSLLTLSYVLEGNGHVLSQELTNSLVDQLLLQCRISVDEEDAEAAEDARDSFDAPPVCDAASLCVNGPALRCLNSLLLRSRANSYLIKQFGSRITSLLLHDIRMLISAAPLTLAYCLNALQSVVSAGKSTSAWYSAHLPWLLEALHPLLFASDDSSLDGVASDDSSAWDTDATPGSQERGSRLQVHILLLMAAIAKSNFQAFVVDMGPFLPFIGPTGIPSAHSMYALSLYHSSCRVRMHAILTLGAILFSGRSLFTTAQFDSNSNRAFLALSNKLALILRDIHGVLAIALRSENDQANVQHLMNTAVALANVTPYSKVASGWLLPILKAVERLCLDRNDPNAPSCIASIMRVRKSIPDVSQWLEQSGFLSKVRPDASASLAILGFCCENYGVVALKSVTNKIDYILQKSLLSESLMVDSISCLKQYLEVAEDAWPSVLQKLGCQPLKICPEWISLISSVPVGPWNSLSDDTRSLVMSSALDSRHTLEGVQSLGRLLLLTPLPVNFIRASATTLLANLKSGIEQKKDSGRLRSVCLWALGNLVSRDSVDSSIIKECLPCAVSALSAASVGASVATSDKIVYGGLRIISFAFTALDEDTLRGANVWDITWEKCIDCLGDSNKPKVRWNSANTLASLIKSHPNAAHRRAVWSAIKNALANATNWKVRISALQCIQENPAFFGDSPADLYAEVLQVSIKEVSKSEVGLAVLQREQRQQFIRMCHSTFKLIRVTESELEILRNNALKELLGHDPYAQETLQDAEGFA